MYSIQEISSLCGGTLQQLGAPLSRLQYLSTDTRTIIFGKKTVFFAIKTDNNDGHNYIQDALNKGCRNFLVSDPITLPNNVNVIRVSDTLQALQSLSANHRQNFNIPVIAVVGSNGKTIIKEWLSELLSGHKKVCKSPKSYNSQIGVPLSVWTLNESHEIAIFEAGISQKNEMDELEKIIRPDFVIFSNIGSAHDAGFDSREQKISEKLKICKNAKAVIYNSEHQEIEKVLQNSNPLPEKIKWSSRTGGRIQFIQDYDRIVAKTHDKKVVFKLPFSDSSSIENICHCLAVLDYLAYDLNDFTDVVKKLRPIQSRLEIKQGANNNLLINDSYSNDIESLKIALDCQERHADGLSKTIILGDFVQMNQSPQTYSEKINTLLLEQRVENIVLIGKWHLHSFERSDHLYHYDSGEEFLTKHSFAKHKHECILIKGARKHKLERAYSKLALLNHDTVLEINLEALASNLQNLTSRLNPETKTICVIKASAYGSGAIDIAKFLAFKKVDYLAVAYLSEGIQLRKAGITLPIMVLTPSEYDSINDFLEYDLEPQVYSIKQLQILSKETSRSIGIHLNLDTGINRLGFSQTELSEVIALLQEAPHVKVKSIFSHLSASDRPEFREFSQDQFLKFEKMKAALISRLDYTPFSHILNSGGILNFPDKQYDAVRIGIGMYGIGEAYQEGPYKLEKVHTLKSRVIRIKKIKAGESIGYNRLEIAATDMVIGILPIGYADGLLRKAGNRSFFCVSDQTKVPIIGQISMDMMAVDLTNTNVQVGQFLEIFGANNPIELLAKACDTIPYEILSRIAPRVKRIIISDI